MATTIGLIFMSFLGIASDDPRPVNAYAEFDPVADVDPVIVTAGGRTLAVWNPVAQGCDPLVATSDDGGVNWSEPSQLKTNIGLDDGFTDAETSLATDGDGSWIVVWTSSDTLGGTLDSNYDILAARSTDNGQTWSPPQLVSEPVSFYSRLPHLASDGDGTWIATWGGSGLLVARSTDNGETWEPPVHIIDGLEDRHPKIATDGDGTWLLVWDSAFDAPIFNNDSDVLYVRSLDNGGSWSPIRAVNTDASGPNRTDHLAEVAVDVAGNWVVAWQAWDFIGSDWDLRYARSTDGGLTWSAPALLNSDATTDAFGETDEQVELHADPAGRWIASWRAYKEGAGKIRLSRSSDGGSTWSQLETVESSGSDSDPNLVADAASNWLLVVESTSSLQGTIGTDVDLLSRRLRVSFDTTCAGDADADGHAGIADPGCPLGGLADCDDTDITVAPGAVQSCDGLNNDCLHPSWPALTGTNEVDDDGDGLSECAGDCDDSDASSWSLPSVVTGVVVGRSGSAALVEWDPVGDPGGDFSSVVYDVIRGEAPFVCSVVGPQSCIESDDDTDRSAEDPLDPAAGGVVFYQVRAENDCHGVGRLGFAGDSGIRVAIDCR